MKKIKRNAIIIFIIVLIIFIIFFKNKFTDINTVNTNANVINGERNNTLAMQYDLLINLQPDENMEKEWIKISKHLEVTIILDASLSLIDDEQKNSYICKRAIFQKMIIKNTSNDDVEFSGDFFIELDKDRIDAASTIEDYKGNVLEAPSHVDKLAPKEEKSIEVFFPFEKQGFSFTKRATDEERSNYIYPIKLYFVNDEKNSILLKENIVSCL